MYKVIISVISGYLLSFGLFAQTNSINLVLTEIEQNNKELKAYQSFIESRQLDFKTTNNLPDPQASFYYLPFGTHSTGDYTEFQISQSFEFPTVYGARKKWIDQQENQLQLKYDILQQNILFSAKMHCLKLISLNKKIDLEEQRMQRAKKMFDQVQQLYEKEQVGILDLNKAKISWLQNQFTIEQIENDRNNILIILTQLNGSKQVSFDQGIYPGDLEIMSFDSIWQDKMSIDPAMIVLKEEEEASQQNIKLKKNETLPDLIAGYNYQGIAELNYSGVYGGISIPIWNNKNKVKTAKAQYQYQQIHTEAITSELHSEFQEQYNKYRLLFRKFKEYQTTLGGLNSELLLFEAYDLGDISYMEYYIELLFYRQAFDKMLQVEYDLNRLKAEILKYKL